MIIFDKRIANFNYNLYSTKNVEPSSDKDANGSFYLFQQNNTETTEQDREDSSNILNNTINNNLENIDYIIYDRCARIENVKFNLGRISYYG